MKITTDRGNTYSYIPVSNEIVSGFVEENEFEWRFNPLKFFTDMPNVGMFIIGVTEQCNLRCRYCCYSGSYSGKRNHGFKNISYDDVDSIIEFIDTVSAGKPKRIAFYGGEPILNFKVIRYCVELCRGKWGADVLFSISTNGVLLDPERIDWLIKNDIEIAISLDGSKEFHDKNRVDTTGNGTFERIKDSITYIYRHYENPNVSFHVTLANVRDLIEVAEGWHRDELLRTISPTMVHGLTPNFDYGVPMLDYEDVKCFYTSITDVYQQHPHWLVLKVFLDEAISAWKERLIFDIDEPVEMSTCLPVNTKLYIDSSLDIAVCEKFSDKFRIGTISNGIDWDKANHLVKKYANSKLNRCTKCPIFRMCDICLTSIEYTPEQLDILCNNERVYARVSLYAFCEMAERGLIK